MAVLLEGPPISTEELGSSVSVTIGLLSLARQPALGRVLMKATVFLGTFNAANIFWCPSPDLCLDTVLSRSTMDNSLNLIAWFLL